MVNVWYVYEPQFAIRGWSDDAGVAFMSWFDKDLAEVTVGPSATFVNQSTFFAPLIIYEVFPNLFVNVSTFFPPRVFMLTSPDELLKNEVRRTLMIEHQPPRTNR